MKTLLKSQVNCAQKVYRIHFDWQTLVHLCWMKNPLYLLIRSKMLKMLSSVHWNNMWNLHQDWKTSKKSMEGKSAGTIEKEGVGLELNVYLLMIVNYSTRNLKPLMTQKVNFQTVQLQYLYQLLKPEKVWRGQGWVKVLYLERKFWKSTMSRRGTTNTDN